jgi:hypothetical protein
MRQIKRRAGAFETMAPKMDLQSGRRQRGAPSAALTGASLVAASSTRIEATD